ncbi:opioid growth factor receptor-like protein 1 [Rhinoderma darwinii]|uniref:opioid growth factor receptor-like protein 1 n=1 Tax=Rhinoderma darwinii TaxID=43563 RepID=UPI003F663A01
MGQMATKSKKKVSPKPHVQWEPDYDSTWEEEDERSRKQRPPKNQFHFTDPRCVPSRDLQMYRRSYPQNQVIAKEQSSPSSIVSCFGGDDRVKNDRYYRDKTSNLTPNLDFYQNKEPFKPNGVYIEELLTKWKSDYYRLERSHTYIQWLFPLRERGRNASAKPLTLNEIQIMKRDREVRRRFLAAYRLMLEFYGIKLQDCETGKVTREKNWMERFYNLNNHSHNNLRITRILKCLGEMGFEHFQAPLVCFFLEETLCNNYLPNVARSVLDYFIFTVKDKQERRKLVQFAWENYKSQEPFIWGPVEKLQSYRKGTGSEGRSAGRNRKFSR